MAGIVPRDMQEWLRNAERTLQQARAASGSVYTALSTQLGDYAAQADLDRERQPGPPIELTAQTYIAYFNGTYQKEYRAGVIVDFPDVTVGMDAEALEISGYELWGRTGTEPFARLVTAEISSLQWFGAVPGSDWEFKARAIGTYTTKPGVFSAVLPVTMTLDTTAPGQPSTPTATGRGRAITLRWDGLVAGGTTMPLDLDYVIVAAGTEASPTEEVYRFGAGGADLFVDTDVEYNTTKFYRLKAVDTSGNESPWSVQAAAYGSPLVDADIIISHIDAAETEIINIGSAALADNAVTLAKLADNAVSQAKLQNGVISLAKLDTTVDAKITKGVTDAATADAKAVNAQAKADAAKALADAALAAGVALSVNGDFDAPITSPPLGWPTRSLTTVQASATTARSGANVLKASPTLNSAYAYTDYFESATGRTFYVEYWVRLDQAMIAGNENLLLGAFFSPQDTAGAGSAVAVYSNGAAYPAVLLSQLSTTTWTKFAVTYTVAQANNVKLRVGPRLPAGATTSNSFEVDNFRVIDVTESKAALDAAAAAQASATTAITNANTAQTTANGKNTITNSIADAAIGVPGVSSGDRWQKWSTLSTGGKLLATWRWNGAAWIAEALDPTYIPQLDIGTGTFGNLSGSRITAKTISVASLLVGSFDNVIPDPYFVNTNAEWGIVQAPYTFPATEGYGGLSAFKIDPNALQAGRYGRRIPVEAGSSYRVQVWAKSDVDIPANSLGVYHNYAVAGSTTPLGPVNILKQTNGSVGNDFIPANTWTLLTATATINALADTAAFGFYKQTTFTTGTVWFSQASAVRMGDGNLIVDGSITSSEVAANAITAKHLRVGDFQNFAIGSDFEDATAVPWTLATKHTLSATQKKYGVNSLRLASDAALQTSTFTGDLRVKEGEQYYFKYHAYIDATFNGTTGNSKLRIGDQAGALITDKTYADITRSAWTTAPLEVTVTVPAGVTSLQVTLLSDNTAGLAYVDDIQIRRVAEASLIQNLGVEKLVVGAASIGTAVVDKFYAEVVQSRKILTNMLVVGDFSNMIPNAQMQNGTTGWTTLNCTIAAVTAASGLPGLKVTKTSGTLEADAYPEWVDVTPGEKVRLSFTTEGTWDSGNASIYGVKKNASGTVSIWNTSVPLISTPGDKTVMVTIPADAVQIQFRPYVSAPSSLGTYAIFSNMVARRMSTSSLIVDGAVVADSLTVTDTMWAKIIQFKKLTGNEIDVNALTADTAWIGSLRTGVLITDAITTTVLKADAITSKHTITGAKFQTTTTANRGLKIDSAGMKMWTSAGVNTIDLNASTGYATLTGRIRTAADGDPGVVLIPPVESDDGKTMAMWFTPDTSVLAGGITGGMWLSNPATSSTPGQVNIRGQQYGGLKLWDAIEFASNTASLPQFFSNAASGLQATAYNGNLYLTSGGAETRIKSLFNTSINVGTGKTLNLQVNSSPYSATNGASANLLVFTDGNVFKSTSASKYKILPEPMVLDERLLDEVVVKDWIDKGMAERYAESFEFEGERDVQEQREYDALSLERIPGAIAEDVAAAGGEKFVVRDLAGEIDGLMYDRLALARTEILKRRVAAQADEMGELWVILGELVETVTQLQNA